LKRLGEKINIQDMSLLEKLCAQTKSVRDANAKKEAEERKKRIEKEKEITRNFIENAVQYLENKMNEASKNGRDNIFWDYKDYIRCNEYYYNATTAIDEIKKIFSKQGIRAKKIDESPSRACRRRWERNDGRRGLEFSWKK
jgi:hypothetical protein